MEKGFSYCPNMTKSFKNVDAFIVPGLWKALSKDMPFNDLNRANSVVTQW